MAKRGKVQIVNGARVLPPANDVEFDCFQKMVKNGYTVIKSGYPDLFCFKNGKIVLIECKPTKNEKLKTNQKIILKLLAGYGVPCFKYSPDGGLVQILPD